MKSSHSSLNDQMMTDVDKLLSTLSQTHSVHYKVRYFGRHIHISMLGSNLNIYLSFHLARTILKNTDGHTESTVKNNRLISNPSSSVKQSKHNALVNRVYDFGCVQSH